MQDDSPAICELPRGFTLRVDQSSTPKHDAIVVKECSGQTRKTRPSWITVAFLLASFPIRTDGGKATEDRNRKHANPFNTLRTKQLPLDSELWDV
jgi:hypothetical protein